MALLTTGKPFIRDLEQYGALGVYAPLEGGYEGRYQRRLRATGYNVLHITARVHGVRPPHLGKKNIGREAAVGPVYFIPPIATYQLENLPPKSKGLVIWIIESFVLSSEEKQYLINLSQQEPRLKFVLELGGERYFRWQPLSKSLVAA